MNRYRNTLGMFDLSKGILMVLVLLGHSINVVFKYWDLQDIPGLLYIPLGILKFFFFGCIPLFFMISGYGFRRQKLSKCLKVQWQMIIIKYIIVSVIVIAGECAKNVILGKPVIDKLKTFGSAYLLGICPGKTTVGEWYIESIGPVWFLVALVLATLILNTLFLVTNEYVRMILLAVGAAAITRLPFGGFIPFCIYQSVICACFMYIGYMIKKEKVLLNPVSKWTLAIFILICVADIPFGNIEVSQNVYKFGFLDFAVGCIAGYLLLELFMIVSQKKGFVSTRLKKIGFCSLDILCIHTIEYVVVPWEKISVKIPGNTVVRFAVIFMARVIIIFCAYQALKLFRMTVRKIKK